jgi:hypothetical protein
MRSKIALAGLAVGVAATFLPVSSASAACIHTYYELTGHCSPCPNLPDNIPADCIA